MGKIVLAVIAVVLALGLMGGCGSYNGLVGSNQEVNKQWAQVEAQYQRRMDLIPNLVKTVEGAANFEKSTLKDITDARASVGSIKITPGQAPATAEELKKFQDAQGSLWNAVSRLLAVSERYPELKATQGFRDLQVQLEGTENRVNTARQDFNNSVKDYNTKVQQMPGAIFASLFKFNTRPYFTSETGADKAPKVEFGAPAPR